MCEQARFGAVAAAFRSAIVQKNGDIVRLAPGEPEKIGHAAVGRLVLDGDVILPADGATMNERRRLAIYGQMSVAVAIGGNGRAGRQPAGAAAGRAGRGGPRRLPRRGDARRRPKRSRKHKGDRDEAARSAPPRRAPRRDRWTGKKPVVDVLIVEA